MKKWLIAVCGLIFSIFLLISLPSKVSFKAEYNNTTRATFKDLDSFTNKLFRGLKLDYSFQKFEETLPFFPKKFEIVYPSKTITSDKVLTNILNNLSDKKTTALTRNEFLLFLFFLQFHFYHEYTGKVSLKLSTYVTIEMEEDIRTDKDQIEATYDRLLLPKEIKWKEKGILNKNEFVKVNEIALIYGLFFNLNKDKTPFRTKLKRFWKKFDKIVFKFTSLFHGPKIIKVPDK